LGFRDRRGVSPVIATIIIVAIAIVMALAVAYWMLGLGGAFTRFEKLEFVSAYTEVGTNDTGLPVFNISIRLKNSGSADATIDMIFLNGKPIDSYINKPINTVYVYASSHFGQNTLKPGDSIDGYILLLKYKEADENGAKYSPWKPGMTVEVMVQTVSGRQYPKSVILP
jgi:flagellin-like protein